MKIVMRILLGLTLSALLAFCFVACSGGGDGGSSVSSTGGDPDPVGTTTPAALTSAGLIDQALGNGEIDSETATIYKAYATFGDPRLPTEYTGEEPGIVDPDFLWDAQADFENLSPEAQEALAPFLIPPMYSGSWWYRQQNYQATASLATATSLPCNPLITSCPILEDWTYLAGANINVWYQNRYAATDQVLALTIMNMIEAQAWPTLTAYMGVSPQPDNGGPLTAYEGPDSKLDIALVDMGPLGTTFPSWALKKCGDTSTYILINRGADVAPTAVHEFMHAIQFAMPVQECLTSGYKTMMESTANWAVNHLFTTTNQWEHQHTNAYTNDITKSLLAVTDPIRPYGAWLFPLYLTEKEGSDLVKQAWNLAATNSQAQVLENLVDLDVVWPEFAVRLWNQPPFDELTTWDAVTNVVSTGLSKEDLTLNGATHKDWVVTPGQLSGLSANITHLVFKDNNIRTAGFFNGFTFKQSYKEVSGFGQIIEATSLSSQERLGAHVHALVKKNGVWENTLRDWTDTPYVSFCRDFSGETVDELLLVFTNSSSDVNHKVQYTGLPSHLWLTNMPCASPWEGNVNFAITVDGVSETFQAAGVKFEPLQTPTSSMSEMTQLSGPMSWPYQLTAGSVSWSISGTDSSGCRYSSNETEKILTPGFFPNQFMLHSFVRSGPAVHGFTLNGFDQSPNIQWSATETCPDGSGGTKTTTVTRTHDKFMLPVSPGVSGSATLSNDGLYASGSGSDALDSSVTGTWQLAATP